VSLSVSLRNAIGIAAAFAALAALVAAGVFTGLDQWSIDHLMPGRDPRPSTSSLAGDLVPLLGSHWRTPLGIIANLVTVPASFLVALAIVAWRSRLLAVVLCAAVAVEVVCKEALVRPALYDGTFHIEAFDSSFPSGHALRTVLVAAAVWPLARRVAAAWVIASLALLLLAGWHTPTDLAGGVLLAGLALLGARALRARRLRA
jgi:membrane-associated phospholipid phosphatase